jgi:hypothetical protein
MPLPRNQSAAYEEYALTLAAGAIQKNVYCFDWLEIISNDNDTIEVSYDGGNHFSPLRRGIMLRPEGGINAAIILRNGGVATSIFTLATGTSEMDDNRLVLAGLSTLPVSLTSTEVEGRIAAAAAHGATKPVLIGGSDGTNARHISVDASGRPNVNINGTVPVSGNVGVMAVATGGTDRARVVSAATNNATVVKASAGKVCRVKAINTNAAKRYLKLYDKATAPVVGTDVPAHTIELPATSATDFDLGDVGDAFANGIGYGIVTGVGDTDNTAVGAGDVIATIHYK